MSRDESIKLFEVYHNRIVEIIKTMQVPKKVYVSIVVSIVGFLAAILAYMINNKIPLPIHIPIIVGGGLIIFTSAIGWDECRNASTVYMDNLLMVAKLEAILGFHTTKIDSASDIFPGETLSNPRHVNNMKGKTSEQFLKTKFREGYMVKVSVIFGITILLGILMIAFGICYDFSRWRTFVP